MAATKVLLHICCGVCALHSIDKLKKDSFLVAGFFYNPNIFPESEYLKRRDTAKQACDLFSIDFFEGPYGHAGWVASSEQYKNEPEGAKRCSLCYEMRIKEAFLFAQKNGFDHLTSTLTISPHKNSKKIFSLAQEICGDKYLAIDFKKEDGFKKTAALAREHNFYRQNYCGCEYSFHGK
jgi:predicted adenine nucleotide alpha hydrolase (AANH) superfamily ATPase